MLGCQDIPEYWGAILKDSLELNSVIGAVGDVNHDYCGYENSKGGMNEEVLDGCRTDACWTSEFHGPQHVILYISWYPHACSLTMIGQSISLILRRFNLSKRLLAVFHCITASVLSWRVVLIQWSKCHHVLRRSWLFPISQGFQWRYVAKLDCSGCYGVHPVWQVQLVGVWLLEWGSITPQNWSSMLDILEVVNSRVIWITHVDAQSWQVKEQKEE